MILAVVMECLFSATFITELCGAGTAPDAVVIAHHAPIPFDVVAPRHNLLQSSSRVDELCHRVGIPVYRVYHWQAVPDSFLQQFSFVVVACFPRLLPAQRLARLGVPTWNVHP